MLLIKRYPNRKLYDTQAKQYITLDGIANLIRQGQEIQVTDHVTGEDITALTLTQIILEQERKQSGVLSHTTLMNLVRLGSERLTALQRGLFSPGFWQQIDEEIRQRVQALVHQGELTVTEGEALLKKLIEQGLRQRQGQHGQSDAGLITIKELEEYLQRRQLPSQADLQRLYIQLEELSSRLEELSQSND
ncbi:MAG: polyhydroxyalkanoate synthesis regulator DNA-binding domain-containing protein [Chloroflexota bacterium]